ncbi:hypothetical protein [Mycoplasma todarodis]|uniref:DUF4064 domain-containing protein n=1 Tax=Mycoplasma todarodis TaxID=1937191 RepID=A0A4R0XT89_9MOLU|nr:hypothetical protein [Mycoplasma todarodis]TCG12113.1 hypothetical protein C4B25_00260 [Mycoplasma todarodis]
MRKRLIATGVLSIIVTILTIIGMVFIIKQVIESIDSVNSGVKVETKYFHANWTGTILCGVAGIFNIPLLVLGVIMLIKRKPNDPAASLILFTAIFAICGLTIISSVTSFLALAKIDKSNREETKEESKEEPKEELS